MKRQTSSESAEIGITVKPIDSWKKDLSIIRMSGIRMANELRKSGHNFLVRILAPREVKGSDTVPLAGIKIDLNWKVETRLRMVESANNMIADAYLIDSLDPGFPAVLSSIIEGKGLYEHGIGEFFLLYGKFEQKHKLRNGKATRAKMLELIKGDKQYLRSYIDRGKTRNDPLPYAVKNILSHVGSNPNKFEVEELRSSIILLKTWVPLE